MMAGIAMLGFYFWRRYKKPLQEEEGCQLHHSCTAPSSAVISGRCKRIH
jgi:hypothetical protein